MALNSSLSTESLVTHKGGCHCAAVKFMVQAPKILKVIKCNCSICTMRQNWHFVVPKSQFCLLQGSEFLTSYRFGTRRAEHLFCKICGILSFYQPRSNPDCYAITINCLEQGTVEKINFEEFDGKNWEEAFAKTKHGNDLVSK